MGKISNDYKIAKWLVGDDADKKKAKKQTKNKRRMVKASKRKNRGK